ncbi:hypothetical protein SteCoe_3978 [Stentor coeruleus]|uniref:Uncharacterized protein n=1 Tax=Stentor coeruleus TaxID=5963 RepID=A0A1R2CVX0_9CILI|nr:hypothetical protein SteCoe_3978 [Stentor coeruleus]
MVAKSIRAIIMCIHNPLCNVADGTCRCHFENIKDNPQSPHDFECIPESESVFLIGMMRLISQQNQMISSIIKTAKEILIKISEPHEREDKSEGIYMKTTTERPISEKMLEEYLFHSETSFTYFLELINEPPSLVYNQRAFSLSLTVVDSFKKPVILEKPQIFKLSLYTAENPPKLLKTCISGDKIVSGTTKIQTSSQVVFEKILINEVTSHLITGAVFLVISAEPESAIKPYIIKNFIVKARKRVEDKCIKMHKGDLQDNNIEKLPCDFLNNTEDEL